MVLLGQLLQRPSSLRRCAFSLASTRFRSCLCSSVRWSLGALVVVFLGLGCLCFRRLVGFAPEGCFRFVPRGSS